MPKKSEKKLKRKTRHKAPIILIVLALMLVGILIALFFRSDNRCANSRTCTRDLSGNYDPQNNEGVFLGQKVYAPSNYVAYEEVQVLGDTDTSNKRIEIDLTNQKIYAFEVTTLCMSFLFQAANGAKHRPVIFGSG